MAIKVWLFSGQSNASGYGNRLQLAPVPTWGQTAANGWEGHPTQSADSGIEYAHPTLANFPLLGNQNNTGLMAGVFDSWGAYEGQTPKYPSGEISEMSSYGPELSFLRKYQDEHPGEQLAEIKCSLGGSSIEEWLPTGTLWPMLKAHIDQAEARLAGQDYEWAGLVWHQGESGASSTWQYLNPEPGNEYKDKLRTFLAAVRQETSPTMPVVICRIGNHMLAPAIIGTTSNGYDTPENRIAATEDRRMQQVEVAGDAGNCWVDTDNLPVLQSGDPQYWYHHTGSGYLAMGERAHIAYSTIVPPPPPPEPEPLTVIVRENGIESPNKTATVTLNGANVGESGDTLEVNVLDN